MKTLGERVKAVRKERGLTQKQLADLVETSQNSITKIENGGNTTLTLKIARALGVDPSWLDFGDGAQTNIGNQTISGSTVNITTANHINQDRTQSVSKEEDINHRHRIDYLDVRAAAGLVGFENSDYPEIVSSLFLSDEGMLRIIGRKSAVGVKIVNVPTDSMEPTIRKDDWVLLDTNVNYYNGDGVYALVVDGALFVKRIQKLIGGGYRLHSDNKEYDPQDISDEICQNARFIGRFIKTIHIDIATL